MKLTKTEIEGAYIIEPIISSDKRGRFVKIFNDEFLNENGIKFVSRESYFSTSKKNVIRGMHFQTPPYHHIKIVYVITGSITDVILDLRKDSSTFLKFISIELSASNSKAILIPRGCAHGFISLEDDTTTVYNVEKGYHPNFDRGIKYDSFGYKWMVDSPIISDRDMSFENIEDLKSPF